MQDKWDGCECTRCEGRGSLDSSWDECMCKWALASNPFLIFSYMHEWLMYQESHHQPLTSAHELYVLYATSRTSCCSMFSRYDSRGRRTWIMEAVPLQLPPCSHSSSRLGVPFHVGQPFWLHSTHTRMPWTSYKCYSSTRRILRSSFLNYIHIPTRMHHSSLIHRQSNRFERTIITWR